MMGQGFGDAVGASMVKGFFLVIAVVFIVGVAVGVAVGWIL